MLAPMVRAQVEFVRVDGDPIQIIGEETGYPQVNFSFSGTVQAEWPTANPSQLSVTETQSKSSDIRIRVTGDDPVIARLSLTHEYTYNYPTLIDEDSNTSFPGNLTAFVAWPGPGGVFYNPSSDYGTSAPNTFSVPCCSGSGVDTDSYERLLYPGQEYTLDFNASARVDAGLSIGTGTSVSQNVSISLEILPDIEPSFDRTPTPTLIVDRPRTSESITLESTNINSTPIDLPITLTTDTEWLQLAKDGLNHRNDTVEILWKAGETVKFEVGAQSSGVDLGKHTGTITGDLSYSINVELQVGAFMLPRVIDQETGRGVPGVEFSILRNGLLQYRLYSGDSGYPSPPHLETVADSYVIEIPPGFGASDSSRSAAIASNGAGTFPVFQVTQSAAMVQVGLATNAPGLRWASSPDPAPWFAQTAVSNGDGYAAQSGAIGAWQTSKLQTTVNGPGTLSFYWKVSSDDPFDLLTCYLDDSWQFEISGEVDWEERTIAIPDGVHVVSWEYSKDGSQDSGLDAGFLDNVTFTPNVSSPEEWLTNAGLFNDSAELDAEPYKDGVPNLLKYAFNLNASGPDNHTLFPDKGTSGLPHFQTLEENDEAYFQLEYVRRKDSALTYEPMISSNLVDFSLLTGEEEVTDLGNGWERVVISKPISLETGDKHFGKVQVSTEPVD